MTGPSLDEALRPLVFIGENNPYGNDERYALFDEPPGSAGGRFRRLVLAIPRREYFLHDRMNLLQQPRWSVPRAREAAANVMRKHRGRVLVLLGRKVANAFGGLETWAIQRGVSGTVLVSLPHPSGLCRLWQVDGTYARARALVVEAAPWVELGTLP